MSIEYNKSIILYLHIKGTYHYNSCQAKVRYVWKYEFTKPNSNILNNNFGSFIIIYIQLLKNNQTDIALPLKYGICTWFNEMFISNRAFKLMKKIPFDKTIDRYYNECSTFKQEKNYPYIITYKIK